MHSLAVALHALTRFYRVQYPGTFQIVVSLTPTRYTQSGSNLGNMAANL